MTYKHIAFPALLMAAGILVFILIFSGVQSQKAWAQNISLNHSSHDHDGDHGSHADHGPLAPIGVMGDHMHKKGEWMLSYRFMRMEMDGNRDGQTSLTPEEVIALPNPFGSTPSNLRIVPTSMTMDMHMVGAMYGVTDYLTVAAMANYIDQDMTHITFNGAGAEIGGFQTRSAGFGDSRLNALIRLYEDDRHHVHLNAGVSIPTGSITQEDEILNPAGATVRVRLPYPMQLGSGTYDAMPGMTYTGNNGQAGTGGISWGAQIYATIRLEDENSEGYSLGDEYQASAWASWQWHDRVSSSLRLIATTRDEISGSDPNIVGPVTTADPGNHGGETLEIGVGSTIKAFEENGRTHEFALEGIVPIHRDLNGPQLETDYRLVAGWRVRY